MKGFPKYFNSKEDYLNLLRGWPPAYAGRSAQMIAAVDRLEGTAFIDQPVWPEGYDPNNPGADPVAPIGTESVPDANGEIYRLGLDLDKTAAIKHLVGSVDPAIEVAGGWQLLADDGALSTLAIECSEMAGGIAGLDLDAQLQAVADGISIAADDHGEALYVAITTFVADLQAARESILAGI